MLGYEFYSVEMDRATKDGEEFLKPKEIKVRPKAEHLSGNKSKGGAKNQ